MTPASLRPVALDVRHRDGGDGLEHLMHQRYQLIAP
jgi:hypothetical protein